MASKKKKAPQVPNPPTSSPPPKAVTQVPAVALLIDGENVVVPDLIAHILVEAGKLGGVTVRHVYGNWSAPSMQPWKKQLTHYRLEPLGNRSGPNATDIALVIGGMDLLYRGFKHFCLVAGDSDYVPLVQRLRRDGCIVVVIGTSAVSTALKEISTLFVSTDQLVPQTSSALPVVSSPPSSPSELFSSQAPDLSTMLTDAYTIAVQQSETEWVLLAKLGTALRENAAFEAAYGKQKLSGLVKQCSDGFEIQKRENGKGEAEVVRLRNGTQNGIT